MSGYVYNWQAGKEDFLKWMVINLVSGMRDNNDDDEMFERLSEATDKWQRIELTILINGEEVPVHKFVEGIERNMERNVRESVAETVKQLPDMEYLREALYDAERAATNVLRSKLYDAGIMIDDPYDED